MFPAGVHVASTWDPSLIYARGNAMGTEAKGVGVHVQLAPVAGALVSQPVSAESHSTCLCSI